MGQTSNKKTKQIIVFVGICIKKNKILMCLRDEPECPDAHLKWELPGGKCDYGETPKQSLEREFLEETGVEIKVGELIPFVYTHYWKYKWGVQQTLVLTYKCQFIKKVNKPQDHHVKEVKWIQLRNIRTHDLLAGTSDILDKLK